MTIFKHERTQQVIEAAETKPSVFDVLGTPMELSIMNTCGWWKCDTDPGYRGMPKASADELDSPSADSLSSN